MQTALSLNCQPGRPCHGPEDGATNHEKPDRKADAHEGVGLKSWFDGL